MLWPAAWLELIHMGELRSVPVGAQILPSFRDGFSTVQSPKQPLRCGMRPIILFSSVLAIKSL